MPTNSGAAGAAAAEEAGGAGPPADPGAGAAAETGPPPKVVTTARGYTRTLHARRVSFRCEWCSTEREVWQYPGAAPRYCAGCRAEAQQCMNSARQREKRARDTNPYAWRRPVGRPRGS